MKYSLTEISEFKQYFSGNIKAYGIHIYGEKTAKGEKEKGQSFTKKELLDTKLYEEHLEGKQGLGIIPLTHDGKCNFVVLDVDEYSDKTNNLIKSIYEHDLPLVPFRSKSGGLHLYLFFEKPTKANIAKDYIISFRNKLGLDNKTEIFPKQDKLKDGQVGNWINLPYYNAVKSSAQGLIKEDLKTCSLREALNIIREKRVNKDILETTFEELPLADGPPCLQTIYMAGDTQQRNEYLFNYAIYAKTKYGKEDFEFKVVAANNLLARPLALDEITKTIINTHKKKDYTYRCNQEPICSVCNREVCITKKFGVQGEDIPDINFEGMIRYMSHDKKSIHHYEWNINGQLFKFSNEEDIIKQQTFIVQYMRNFNFLPKLLKNETWRAIVNRGLSNIEIKEVEISEDFTATALFTDILIDFLENTPKAANKEQIQRPSPGRVYYDIERKAFIFKKQTFMNHLRIKDADKTFMPQQVRDLLESHKAYPMRYTIAHSLAIDIWQVQLKDIENLLTINPEEQKEESEKYTIEFKKEEHKEAPY